MWIKFIDNMAFRPSTRKNKKYDAYDLDGRYLTSFGDKRYQQYRDTISYYSKLDHNDETRKQNYLKRHAKDNKLAGLLSIKYLWT